MKSNILVISFIILSGCMVGPDYKKPEVSVKDKFSEAKDTSKDENYSCWYKKFNDPVLNDLIEKGIKANYDFSIALEKIEQTRAFYKLNAANLWPEIDMNAEAIRTRVSQNLYSSIITPAERNNFMVGFDAIWEVDIFGRLRRLKKAAFYDMQAQKEFSKDVLIIVISDIAKRYIDIRAFQNNINYSKAKINVQSQLVELTKSSYEAGLVNEQDLQTQIEELNKTRQDLVKFQTLLKQSYYSLAVLVGQQPEEFSLDIFSVYAVPSIETPFISDVPSSILRKRPDIRKAERDLAASTERIGASVAEYFPQFSLTGGISFESNKFHDWITGNSFGWNFGGLMNWPVINFGRVKSKVDERKSIQRQSLLNYEKVIIEALKDVEGSLVAYYNEKENLRLKTEELDALKIKKDLTEDLYNSGLVNFNTYLLLEKQYIDLLNEKIEKERILSTNLVSVFKAFGGGW